MAKRSSGSDTGRVGRRRPDGDGHTTGAGRALYCAAETAAEVPTGEDSSCVAEVTARAAFWAGGLSMRTIIDAYDNWATEPDDPVTNWTQHSNT